MLELGIIHTVLHSWCRNLQVCSWNAKYYNTISLEYSVKQRHMNKLSDFWRNKTILNWNENKFYEINKSKK